MGEGFADKSPNFLDVKALGGVYPDIVLFAAKFRCPLWLRAVSPVVVWQPVVALEAVPGLEVEVGVAAP